ncbi:SDR family oxidoreductase [Phenylobacterium sp. LjRoot225]|uniref:SDR family NAD(P)-dependent oxidoreductase n=1 Tax=Phenylobacterium sp. LjRoot225 TaxID=3342285 RepID=UPI003ECD468B
MKALRFEGRSILVTGGGSGIGRAAALAFAREGGRVLVADLDADAAGEAVEEIRALGGVAFAQRTDATNEDSIVSMVEQAVARHGPLRHAFNNVGLSREGTLETMTRVDWDWTLATTLTSTFLSMKHEVPAMRAAGGGTIVNTASMSGKIFTPAASPAYAAAKAGVIQLSHYASCAHAADGIRVNSVSPGLTATPLIARMFSVEQQNAIAGEAQVIARAVTPEEIAASVLFLSSDEAGMITGRDLEVAGGRH